VGVGPGRSIQSSGRVDWRRRVGVGVRDLSDAKTDGAQGREQGNHREASASNPMSPVAGACLRGHDRIVLTEDEQRLKAA
jgi:hypothetical protein